jgi:hypothetical protein
MMGRPLKVATLISMLVLANAAATTAQDKPVQKPTPLRIQVVISRFQGEKKIASAPYTLAVASNPTRELARLRMGTEVPVPGQPAAPSADGKTPPAPGIQYRPVGTNIDCTVRTVDEGSFQVDLTIEQSSIVDDDQQQKVPRYGPAFRSFRFTNSAVLKDGQTTQFTNASDPMTGEVVRVDVTLNIVK